MQRKEKIKDEDRTEKVCESTQTSKVDFGKSLADWLIRWLT